MVDTTRGSDEPVGDQQVQCRVVVLFLVSAPKIICTIYDDNSLRRHITWINFAKTGTLQCIDPDCLFQTSAWMHQQCL